MYNPDKTAIRKRLTSKYDIPLQHVDKIVDLYHHFMIVSPKRVQNLRIRFIPAILESGTFDNLIQRFEEASDVYPTSLKRYQLFYGDILGQKKYDEYCNNQVLGQTLIGKFLKYGQEEGNRKYKQKIKRSLTRSFNVPGEYIDAIVDLYMHIEITSPSNIRSVRGFISAVLESKTFDHVEILIERFESSVKYGHGPVLQKYILYYGDELGQKKYNEHVGKISYSWSVEYWIEKYGKEEGAAKFKEIKRKRKVAGCVQRMSQNIFKIIDDRFPQLGSSQIYSEKGDGEFVSYQCSDQRNYYYDYVCHAHNIVIEFNGDYWHCNPEIYDKDYLNEKTGKNAAEMWEHDKKKLDHVRSLGYQVFVIWESDWKKDPNLVLEKLRQNLCKDLN